MRTFSKDEIADEYNESAENEADYQQVKWGSAESMKNRFALARREIDFEKAQSWLDVGCGSGVFIAEVLKAFPDLRAIGIDLSEKLLQNAKDNLSFSKTSLLLTDFLDYQEQTVDIVTAIGVLQKTTMTPPEFFRHSFDLLNINGKCLVTTKHLGWSEFKNASLTPESSHCWFTEDEIIAAVAESGLTLNKIGGFLPRTDENVEIKSSHTIFIVAQKV